MYLSFVCVYELCNIVYYYTFLFKIKLTHSLRRRGYGVGPTQKYKLGFRLTFNKNPPIHYLNKLEYGDMPIS